MSSLLDRAYFRLLRTYPVLLRLALITAAGQLAFSMMNNYALPVYLLNHLRISGVAFGATSATFLTVEMLLKFPLGRLSDRLGRRRVIMAGPLVTMFSPAIVASLPARLWFLIFPLRAVDGLGAAAMWPPLFALIGDVVPLRQRAAAMSLINGAYVGAIAVSVALGSVIAEAFHSPLPPFYFASILLVFCAVAAYWAIGGSGAAPTEAEEPPGVSATSTESPGQPSVSAPIPLAAVLAVTFVMSAAVLVLASFVVAYAKRDLRLSGAHLSAAVLVVGLPIILLSLPLGHLADRLGKARTARIALVMSAACMWLIPLCDRNHIRELAALTVVLTACQIVLVPSWLAIASAMAPATRRGGMMAAVSTAEGAGAILGPLLGGALWDIRHPLIFAGSAGLLTIAALLALLYVRREPTQVLH